MNTAASRTPRRPWLRWALVAGIACWVAAIAWFLGSLLFAPWLNPWLRWETQRDGHSLMLLQQSRSELALIRQEAEDRWRAQGQWPATIALPGTTLPGPQLLHIEVPQPLALAVRYGNRFSEASGLRGTRLELRFDPDTQIWACTTGIPAPSSRFVPADCRTATQWSALEWLLALLAIAAVAVAGTAAALFFANPRIRGLRAKPRRLRREPIAELPQLDRQFGWMRCRQSMLAAAAIDPADWRQALGFAQAGSAVRAQMLAARVAAETSTSQHWPLPGMVCQWRLPLTLPVALERVLLYLPDADIEPSLLVRLLRELPSGQDVILVVSPGAAFDNALNGFANDPANLCVCIDQAGLSEWLLHPSPTQVLVSLLGRQLQVTRISPYQTRGGITRPTAFFGRESLLARVLNREPGNYLLVGGRQLGKTSLMKAIERRFAGHPHVQCHYLSLRDHRFSARLAAELGLPADTAIDALVEELSRRSDGRRLLLLIDETDLFLRAEAAGGYAQLSALRSLSEEGRCHFMLAGFWDLYEAATLDYASPIRNFGEAINLGGLERDACIALAVEPLAQLGIHFNDPALPGLLAEACGHRANLVAIACQQMLEQLERGQRLLDGLQLDRAMRSDAMLDALAGWARLSPDPNACLVDRIIVYRIAQTSRHRPGPGTKAQPMTLAGTLADFAGAGIGVDAETVRRSFARLQLAYVLRREGEGYDFAVPLFISQFQACEVAALLAREMQTLRQANPLPL
ncbi:hypothetical protein [Pseudoxanthomonas wuyuanensis]|uniref:AAA domain-containing protein n=1 Tax=Pseudoxanthomonas wuyuanensis TaxID=1073196 RepID=A0A286CZC9_9GAMM|nr:hypothetical protein [Pseudoxanthomonas wuyuanensis]KAF1722334.1 hypothetical protein CSC75_03640 [Pseudoxanthomonas wuyuanensis]SOD51761.1 hypothetical protein SAMN06296416_101859 [Pseudoxanthomonas wuyuanensis]